MNKDLHAALTSSCRRAKKLRAAVAVTFLLASGRAAAFRTAENSESLSDASRVSWPSAHAAFYLSRASLPDGVTEAAAEDAFSRAMKAWQAPSCSQLVVEFAGWTDKVPREADEQNTIGWVTDWTSRNLPSTVPGNTDIAYQRDAAGWHIGEADIWLNAKADWSALSLDAVFTHELGHAVGLLHPCEHEEHDGAPSCADASPEMRATTMFPDYSPAQSSLESDDVAGICYLYPPDDCENRCGVREACVAGTCRAECLGVACGADEVCGAWGCAPEGACLERDCRDVRCEKATDCGPLLRCVAGVCSSGDVAWGSACAANADCAAGGCVAGICQPVCQAAGDCGPNGTCQATDDGRATACVDSGAYERGANCAVGADCKSGLCLTSDAKTFCTTSCASDSECPTDWTCSSVRDHHVCKPAESNAACSVSGAGGCGGPNSTPLLITSFTLLLALTYRRKLPFKVP